MNVRVRPSRVKWNVRVFRTRSTVDRHCKNTLCQKITVSNITLARPLVLGERVLANRFRAWQVISRLRARLMDLRNCSVLTFLRNKKIKKDQTPSFSVQWRIASDRYLERVPACHQNVCALKNRYDLAHVQNALVQNFMAVLRLRVLSSVHPCPF